MSGSYVLREHTADVAVEATGDSIGAVFAAVGDGLAAAMCDDVPDEGGERFAFEREAESLDGLLYDYLGRLIYERDVRGVLPVDNEADVTTPDDADGLDAVADDGADAATADPETVYRIEATARGVPLSAVSAREVKAVTYSDMVIEARDDGWYAYVVFDV